MGALTGSLTIQALAFRVYGPGGDTGLRESRAKPRVLPQELQGGALPGFQLSRPYMSASSLGTVCKHLDTCLWTACQGTMAFLPLFGCCPRVTFQKYTFLGNLSAAHSNLLLSFPVLTPSTALRILLHQQNGAEATR